MVTNEPANDHSTHMKCFCHFVIRWIIHEVTQTHKLQAVSSAQEMRSFLSEALVSNANAMMLLRNTHTIQTVHLYIFLVILQRVHLFNQIWEFLSGVQK